MSAAVEALARTLGERLAARGWRVTTAESCTGGLVAGAITSVAGSSGWFDVGVVTYSNEAKRTLLGVREATLAAHGAVSEPTAREMAEGARARSGAQVAIAVTGIAGPGGAVPGKPVGTVCFAWACERRPTRMATHHVDGDRGAVRDASVMIALRETVALLAAP
jgi:nicotinamide-nucleotide amidase